MPTKEAIKQFASILPTGNMKNCYFFSACFFGFLTTIYAVERVNPACLEKEKAIALLETAQNFLTKAEVSFPSCNEDVNSTDESECGSLTYIEVSKNLISDVIKNFPICYKPIVKDDKDKDDKDKDDNDKDNKDKDNKDKDDKIVKDRKHKDCSDILASGRNKSGIYTIWTGESSTTWKQLRVYCDMETDDGGWTVIQRRGKFPVQQDFYKDWESYKNGFGNVSEEFWLGNENIRVLCREGCKIRFDLVDEKGERGFAFYQNFTLSSGNYRINISGYSGNV
ncbi:Techylectin-5A, partial [Araneus ventricosus]